MIGDSDLKKTEIEKISEFVLDILHYDIESVETIVIHLNDREGIGWRELWHADFTVEEVTPALNNLIAKGFLQVLVYDEVSNALRPQDLLSPVSDIEGDTQWFAITKAGRDAWQNWVPPTSDQ